MRSHDKTFNGLFFTVSGTLDDCCLCFDELTDDKTIDLGCEHKMCKTCARKYFVEHVSELRTERCKCPDRGCDRMADGELIKFFVDIYNDHGKEIVGKVEKPEKPDRPVRYSLMLLIDMCKVVLQVGAKRLLARDGMDSPTTSPLQKFPFPGH